jgi:hypothetical protein
LPSLSRTTKLLNRLEREPNHAGADLTSLGGVIMLPLTP